MSLRYLLAALVMMAAPLATAQVVISEADTRTAQTPDSDEFVELFNDGPGTVDLDDYVLVFFDGAATDNVSYRTIQLNGDLDAGEFYVVCGSAARVDNCDLDIDERGFIDNGTNKAAAIALYEGDAVNYPNGTQPTTANLVDVLLYGDNNDGALRSALGDPSRSNENENGNISTESLQRTPDANSKDFEAADPTPGEAPQTDVPQPEDIDDARDKGAGSTVVVQGIVTRAEGEVVYFQDGTGGLRLFQELGPLAGDVQDDIAGGTIRPGTVINLTGTLTNPNELLQIANGGLQRYDIVGTAPVPNPQVIDLEELGTNGEDYESELIQVAGVQISDNGDTLFDEGSVYEIADPSNNIGMALLDIPDDENTRVEGTPIPDDATLLTGIAIQRSVVQTDRGYRLSLIDPLDVGGNATEGGGGGGGGGGGTSNARLVISEIDVAMPGADTGEFVEIYNTGNNGINLANFVLVFFNGSDDESYLTVPLSGILAAGDYFVVCSDLAVIDTCNLEGLPGDDSIQNGSDAVALYEAAASAFPNGSAPTTTNLVDAIVYDTDDADDAGLLAGLGETVQRNENANGNAGSESIQRSPSDSETFVVDTPTPGDAAGTGGGGGGGLVTIAEARTAGVGEEVTVRGTVTRSMGAFTYIQDGSQAGLAIRQTDGAFADLVAAGAIRPGIIVEVSGTLSEFNGLLQINGDDLDTFSITGAGSVPAPQLVTLAELASNGEAYESELVALTAVTINGMSGVPFTASTTYAISDRTDTTGRVGLRVPNAADTDVDGELVPEAAVTIVGIVSQFNNGGPAGTGYQILVIQDSDVNPEGVDSESGPEGALSIAVANPLTGSAAVSFSVDAPGAVRLGLYDALGRQVAVLAAGDLPAGTHAARIDASTLAPGVYVLRLEAEAGAITRTLTVVR